MAKEIVGVIKCPHCGVDATVHRTARSNSYLYYRCGEVYAGASTGCGTVQIYGASGQKWIRENMRVDPKGVEAIVEPSAPELVADPKGEESVIDPVREPVVAPVIEPIPARMGFFQKMTAGLVGEL
jgi:hypothetical protein